MADTLTATAAIGTELASPSSPSPSLTQSPSTFPTSPTSPSAASVSASPAMSASSPPQSPVVPQSEYDLHYNHYFAHYSDYYANNSAAALAAASASSPGGIYTGSIESAAIAAAASAASYYANYYTKHARNENRAEPAPETQAAFSTTTNTLTTTTAASTHSTPAATQSVGSSTTAATDATATTTAASSTYYATSAANGAYATAAAQSDTTTAASTHTTAVTYAQAAANGAANATHAQQSSSTAAVAASSPSPAVDDVSGTSKTINLATGEISTGTSHTAHQLATLKSPLTTPSITPTPTPATATTSAYASSTTATTTATSTAYPYGYNPWAAYSAFYFGVSPSTSGTNAATALSAAASLTSDEVAAKSGSVSCESWYNQHYPGYCSCTNCSAASSYYASYYASLQSKYAAAAASSSAAAVSTNGVKSEPTDSQQSSTSATSESAHSNGNGTSCTASNLPYYWPYVPHPSLSPTSSASASPSSTSSATPAEVYAAWYAKYYQAMASSGPCACTQCAGTSNAAVSTTAYGSTMSVDQSTSPSNHSKQFCPCSVCVATSVTSKASKCECDTCHRGVSDHNHNHHHFSFANGAASRAVSSSSSAAMSFLLSPSPSPLVPLSRSLSDREQSLPSSARLLATSSSSIGSLLKKMNRRRTESTSDESDGDGSSLLRSPPALSPLLRPSNSPHLSPSLHGGGGVAGVVGGQHLSLAGFSPGFASLSPHISALQPSPPLSSMTFAAPFPRSPRMSHSHIRDVTSAGTVGSSVSSISSFAAASSTSTSTPSSTSFSFFSPATSSRSPKFGIYSSSLLHSPNTFALPSPSLQSLQSLTKHPLDLRNKSPRLTAIKEEKDDRHHHHTDNTTRRSSTDQHSSIKGSSGIGSGGSVNGYNTLNHFLRSPLSLSLNGKSDSDDVVDGSLNSSTFIILQAVEQENNAASGRKRKREEEDDEEDDEEEEEEEEEDVSVRQLKSSHTASLMLSHTPPHSYAASPRNGSSGLNIPLLTPLLSSLTGTFDGDEEEDSAPSSPSTGLPAHTHTSAPTVTDDTMLMQLTDTASSFSALNTLSTLGNGSSCHQCKSLRPVNQLMYCCNNKKRGSKLLQQRDTTKPSCRKKFCDVCIPEHDTRVLTDSGFLFLKDIEARIDGGQQVLYACYDTSTQSIVYKAGRLVLSAPPTHWVDFTHVATRPVWDATSDEYGSTVAADGVYDNRLTLRTTPEHKMYVQLWMQRGETHHPRVAGGAPIPPHKMPAQELAPGYQCDCYAAGRTCTHGYSHYRMYTGAASGFHTPARAISLTDLDLHSPVAALGLHSADELDAFLELFGYWLGNGSMSYGTNQNAVLFAPKQDSDRVYLRCLLVRVHLVCGQHFTNDESDMRLEVREPRWFHFFDDEFGVKYSNSGHYHRQLALSKQSVHSAQRRPSTASSVSASAPINTSANVASRTRAVSVSVSTSISLSSSATTVALMEDEDEPMEECQLMKEEDGAEAEVEDEDDRAKSAKWLPDWVLFRLDARQLRLVISGLRQADGKSSALAVQRQSVAAGGNAMQGEQMICTSDIGFRDQLIQACLHAGYSAYFKLNTHAGEVRGYHAVPDHNTIYTEEEMEAALRVDSSRQFEPFISRHDSWWVCYSEEVNELLSAQDVRFDGKLCRIRQQAAAIHTQPADLYDEQRDGRVWCVSVDHSDQLIFVQRAHCNTSGVVTKVGRTLIIGNCLAKFYQQKPSSEDMIRSGTDSSWECPSCVGICTCAACRRRKEVAGSSSSSAGKGKNGGGGAKKKAVAAAEQQVQAATKEQQQQSAPATAATPAAHTNGHTPFNGTAAFDTLSVPPADNAPLSPLSLSLSPRKKGVHMEYVEGEESPAVIHIARDSIVLPPSYSPRLTPKAENGSSQPMEVDTVRVESSE